MNKKRKEALLNFCKALPMDFTSLELLDTALTHTSYAYEARPNRRLANNQRLEFLGDSVLSLVVSTYIYNKYKTKDEGVLSKLRAFLVCEGTLANLAKGIHLGDYLLLGRGELNVSGEGNPSILADAFEAVIGAYYLDQGFEAVNALLDKLLLSKIKELTKNGFDLDYKTRFQEEVQKNGPAEIAYEQLASQGPAHARTFVMSLTVNGKEFGRGQGHSKKEAEQQAAHKALEELSK
jgi:ribonuclease-3